MQNGMERSSLYVQCSSSLIGWHRTEDYLLPYGYIISVRSDSWSDKKGVTKSNRMIKGMWKL